MCIDLKSFYASVECIERGLDPLNTNLVVADESRTEKTVCLAITPSLKQYGLGGRARLFEVIQKVKNNETVPLSKLTNQIHAHTVEADSKEILDKIQVQLSSKNYLLDK